MSTTTDAASVRRRIDANMYTTDEALTLCLNVAAEHDFDLVMYKARAREGDVTVCKYYRHRDGKPGEFEAGFAYTSVALALAKLALLVLEEPGP